jgi:hypothetical protein
MNTRKLLSTLAVVALFAGLFVSCSPNSLADEDNLYDTEHHGQDKTKIKVPRSG